MQTAQHGYIYILTNPSFSYVKIGFATDVQTRVSQLNASSGLPKAYRVYATYEVDTKLSDKKLHQLIDQLNPSLHVKDEINGKVFKREFFALSPEEAYSILEALAVIHNCEHRLKKWTEEDLIKKPSKKAQDTVCKVEASITSGVGIVPNLPDSSIGIGLFIRTTMQNLSQSGFVFSEESINEMCSNEWTAKVFGRKNKPFMRLLKHEGKPTHEDLCIEGYQRFWNEIFVFGDFKVLISKEWFENHRERFIKWYLNLNK